VSRLAEIGAYPLNHVTDKDFRVEVLPGWEIDDNDRPPRSAKFVAEVSWSWSPVHSLFVKLWLSTDRKRAAWYLYEEIADFDSGKPRHACVAMGKPYRGILASEAAEQLLYAIWCKEKIEEESYGTDFSVPSVQQDGLLTTKDIGRIAESVLNPQ